MRRILFAAAATCAAVAAVLVAPSAAQARGAIDLHKVNLKNQSIPGAACHRSTVIPMHNGHGTGGSFDGATLVADEFGRPVYGDVTHDGHDEAFVPVDCSTGGGTAGSAVKYSWVVFSGGSGHVRVLGLLTARHQWLNAPPTVLQAPKIVKDIAFVHETIWFADDPNCCGTGAASVTWIVKSGKPVVRTSKLAITDRIVTGVTVGRAYLGESTAALKKSFGSSLHSAAYSTGCRDYWHGKNQNDSFGAFIDFTRSNSVFGIYAPIGAVTTGGVGTYSTLAQIKQVYAGHKITVSADHSSVYVKLKNSYLGFTMDTSRSPAYVRSMRIGQYTFVDGQHTCTS